MLAGPGPRVTSAPAGSTGGTAPRRQPPRSPTPTGRRAAAWPESDTTRCRPGSPLVRSAGRDRQGRGSRGHLGVRHACARHWRQRVRRPTAGPRAPRAPARGHGRLLQSGDRGALPVGPRRRRRRHGRHGLRAGDGRRRGCRGGLLLVHGMGRRDFVTQDRQAAHHVAHAAIEHDVGRLVYLSGIVPPVPVDQLGPPALAP